MTITLDIQGSMVVISVDDNMSRNDWDALASGLTGGRSQMRIAAGPNRIISGPWYAYISRDVCYGCNGLLMTYARGSFTQTPAFLERWEQAQRDNELLEQDSGILHKDEMEVTNHLLAVGFARTLKPFQLTNVARLLCLPSGATFTVPGGGKTTEALAIWASTRTPDHRLLVVAPKNALMAWEEEMPLCIPGLNPVRLVGGAERIRELLAEDPIVSLITYQQLITVYQDPLIPHLASKPYQIYVDESHRMKAGAGKRTGEAVLAVGATISGRKLIMSGTPMPQEQSDLVPQFQFLFPGLCPANPEAAIQYVISRFPRYYVRTTKARLGLSQPKEWLVPLELRPAQRLLYRAITEEAVRLAQGLDLRDRQRFRQLARSVMQLIQVCTNPALLANHEISKSSLFQDALKEKTPIKIQVCIDLVRKLVHEGKKVVIWSIFVKEIEDLCERLADLGSEFIHGGINSSNDETNDSSRDAKIRRFNSTSSGCRILIANPAACSEGISLHRVCHDAVYLDRSFNCAHWIQSQDRIHRVGLDPDQKTNLYILSANATIDEAVHLRLAFKLNEMARMLDDNSLAPLAQLFDDSEAEDGDDYGTGMSDEDVQILVNRLLSLQ